MICIGTQTLFHLFASYQNGAPATGLTVTAQVSKDGGAFANSATPVTEVGLGYYLLILSSTEMTASIVLVVASASVGNVLIDPLEIHTEQDYTAARAAGIDRILGLSHDNMVQDQQAYDSDKNMTSARVRVYDTAAHALAAGSTGLLFTYAIAAAYTNKLLTNFSMVRSA